MAEKKRAPGGRGDWQSTPEGREWLSSRLKDWHRTKKIPDDAFVMGRDRRREEAFRWRWLLEHVPRKGGEQPAHYEAALRGLLELRGLYPKITPAIWKPYWKPEPCRACESETNLGPYNFDRLRTEIRIWLCGRCAAAWESP